VALYSGVAPTGLEWQRAFKPSIRAILESSLMV
jgi:hypothetical protein